MTTRATSQGHSPKSGKPSYTETAAWIGSKLHQFRLLGDTISGEHSYRFVSMDMCELAYSDTARYVDYREQMSFETKDKTIPLDDVFAVEPYCWTDTRCQLIINTRHHGKFSLDYESDWDTNELVTRFKTALVHAVKLCELPPKTNSEPF
jgi:hypothetical protein